MEKNIGQVLKNAKTLPHVKKELVQLFKTIRKQAGGGHYKNRLCGRNN